MRISLRLLFASLGLIFLFGCETSLDRAVSSKNFINTSRKEVHSRQSEPIQPLFKTTRSDQKKIQLGKALFHDVRLSKDNSISCASCHDINSGGDDGRSVSIGVGGRKGSLNAPSILNCSLHVAQFWDGRVRTLREQIESPVHNPVEMDSDWDSILFKLKKDPAMLRRFNSVYSTGLNKTNLVDAIVAFETALITTDAPFDKYLQGETEALSKNAQAGYRLFKSIGCISCHQGRLVGGNMFQEFGVMKDYQSHFADDQVGRIRQTNRDVDLHRFKVPSLRNVGTTSPYFHDGQTKSLQDAIRIMAEFQLGEELSATEVQLLEAFLLSLTGELEEDLK